MARLDVEVAGGRLACWRFGTAPAHHTVVAVHGITANSRSWVPVARALGNRASLLAVDIRGRGRSSELPGPYGMDAHERDVLAVLDALGLEHAVLTGHSLGAYIVARVADSNPSRVRALVMVDGGLPIPGSEDVDPQQFLDAFLGPALARLKLRFPDRGAYRDWWRGHPALAGQAGADVADADLAAYADHDLVGAPPDLRSCVNEEAVRADAAELLRAADAANRLEVPARVLCAPRGLLDDPNPMQPLPVARAWAAADPERRSVTPVEGVNHYTITLGTIGAAAVADAIAASCD